MLSWGGGSWSDFSRKRRSHPGVCACWAGGWHGRGVQEELKQGLRGVDRSEGWVRAVLGGGVGEGKSSACLRAPGTVWAPTPRSLCLRSHLPSVPLSECCCLLAPARLSSLILGGLPFRVAASCAGASPAGAAWGILLCVPCPGDRSRRAPQQLPAKCGAGSHSLREVRGGTGAGIWGTGAKSGAPCKGGCVLGSGNTAGQGVGLVGPLPEGILPCVLCLCSQGRKGFPVDMHSLSKDKRPNFITNVKEKTTFS